MNIALIAHDDKKANMIEFVHIFQEQLQEHTLYATGTTGSLIMQTSHLNVIRLKSGPLGGDQQIGSMIAEKKLDLVIFLRDPLAAQPHEPDVNALIRLCDVYEVPLATNIGTADILLQYLEMTETANPKKHYA